MEGAAPDPKTKERNWAKGPHPKAEADLIGGCGCSPLDGREIVQAEASERENSTGCWRTSLGSQQVGFPSDLLGSQFRPVAHAEWVSHLPLAPDTSRRQESRGN